MRPSAIHLSVPTASLLAVMLAGCATSSPRQPIPALDGVVSPVLILPPIARDRVFQSTADRLGEYVYQETARLTRGAVVAAWNVPELEEAAQMDNLASRGTLDVEEAAAMGAVAECRSVLMTDLLDVHPFAPQRMQLTGFLIDVDSHAPLRRVSFPIDGSVPRVRSEYQQFVAAGQRRRQAPLDLTDQGHLARLSPRTFERYVAFVVVRGLIAP
jgi:hypothetical protein